LSQKYTNYVKLFPHVKHVMDKFHRRLPKEELKKFAREVNKKLVSSDYKNHRVEDPTVISSKQAKKVRKYVEDFFERAVVKYTDHQKKKAQSTGKSAAGPSSQPDGGAASSVATPIKDNDTMSDVGESSPNSSAGRKRKRDEDRHLDSPEDRVPPSETPSVKRLKEDEADGEGGPASAPTPPTPPPPPSADSPPTEEEHSMREQEEALMRENEEAQRAEDEAQAQERKLQNGVTVQINGSAGTDSAEMDMAIDGPRQAQQQQQPVLSH
jgi:histone-lysine N-methyltransferase SETD2